MIRGAGSETFGLSILVGFDGESPERRAEDAAVTDGATEDATEWASDIVVESEVVEFVEVLRSPELYDIDSLGIGRFDVDPGAEGIPLWRGFETDCGEVRARAVDADAVELVPAFRPNS